MTTTEYSQVHALLLRKLVDSVEQIQGLLAAQAQAASSVEIKTSTRGHDVAVKVYAGSDVREAGDAAITEYARVSAAIEERLMGGRVPA